MDRYFVVEDQSPYNLDEAIRRFSTLKELYIWYRKELLLSCLGNGWTVGFVFKPEDSPKIYTVVTKDGKKVEYDSRKFEKYRYTARDQPNK